MAKDTNKYQIFTEFDAKTEQAVVTFGKNDRPVKFDELQEREKDVLRSMVIEMSRIVLPDDTPPASAVETPDLEVDK